MQAAEAAELARGEELLLPPDMDYSAIQLSGEDREKLGAARYAASWHRQPTSYCTDVQSWDVCGAAHVHAKPCTVSASLGQV